MGTLKRNVTSQFRVFASLPLDLFVTVFFIFSVPLPFLDSKEHCSIGFTSGASLVMISLPWHVVDLYIKGRWGMLSEVIRNNKAGKQRSNEEFSPTGE